MDIENLKTIANILRCDSIKMTTAAGSGHPSSCMSCAEIMSVLFFDQMNYDVKNSENKDNDEFILSKGHAAPILYSALNHASCIKKDLLSLRKLNSPLEGHPMPNKLPWVKVATGSLGQGLSVGVGMAIAAKMQARNYKTFVLMGDSEVYEGSVYEALQLASHYKLNNLIGIVDINRLGQTGETMLGHKISTYKKRFTAFGWECIVVDGHNVSELKSAIAKAKNSNTDSPKMILAKTIKGKGYAPIENKNGWHGKPLTTEMMGQALQQLNCKKLKMPPIKIQKPTAIKSKKINSKQKYKTCNYAKGDLIATRQAYGAALANLAATDQTVVAVDAEVSNSTYSNKVQEILPQQFVETFINEQNMIGVALGLSKKGHTVFASTFAAFLSRAHDQIRMSALSSANMTICGSHAGVSIGADGASQMGLEDISMMRTLPGGTVFYPSDAVSCEKILRSCSKLKGIKYIRTTRPKTPVLYDYSQEFKVGDFKVLKKSNADQVVLIGSGITLHHALKASSILAKANINAAVIDLYCIQPLDGKKLFAFIKQHGSRLVICEDHYLAGGISEMITHKMALLSTNDSKAKKILTATLFVEGIPHSASSKELLENKKINAKHIALAAKNLLKKK